MSLLRFKTLYISTLQREIRSKVLITVFIITVLILILMGLGYNYMMTEVLRTKPNTLIGEQSTGLLLSIIGWWGYMLAAFFGAGCIKSDYDNNVIVQLVSFPVKRWEYVLARYLGAMSIVFIYSVISLLVGVIMMYFLIDHEWMKLGHIPLAIFSSTLSMGAAATLGLFFSLYFNQILSYVWVILVGIPISVANIYMNGKEFAEILGNFGFLRGIAIVFHWLFPRITVWGEVSTNVQMKSKFDYNLWIEFAHYAGISVLWMVLILYLFRRKEI